MADLFRMKWGVFAAVFCALAALQFPSALAQSAPKYSNEFLSIGVGARGLSMFRTQTAVVGDVTAGYWNPAGLTRIKDRYQASIMHAEYFGGIAKYDYLAGSMRLDSASALSVSLIRFGVDDIPDTRYLYDANGAINYSNVRFFSAADYAFIGSYGRKVSWLPGLSVGGSVKIVHRIAGSFAYSWGFGLDASAQWTHRNWQLGLMLRDVTGTYNAWTNNSSLVQSIYNQTGNEIPKNSLEVTTPKSILGVARYFRIGKDVGVLPALDLLLTFDGRRNVLVRSALVSLDPSLGVELDYRRLAFLRLGIGNTQRVKSFSGGYNTAAQWGGGMGIRLKHATVDYALTQNGTGAGTVLSHTFSLLINVDEW